MKDFNSVALEQMLKQSLEFDIPLNPPEFINAIGEETSKVIFDCTQIFEQTSNLSSVCYYCAKYLPARIETFVSPMSAQFVSINLRSFEFICDLFCYIHGPSYELFTEILCKYAIPFREYDKYFAEAGFLSWLQARCTTGRLGMNSLSAFLPEAIGIILFHEIAHKLNDLRSSAIQMFKTSEAFAQSDDNELTEIACDYLSITVAHNYFATESSKCNFVSELSFVSLSSIAAPLYDLFIRIPISAKSSLDFDMESGRIKRILNNRVAKVMAACKSSENSNLFFPGGFTLDQSQELFDNISTLFEHFEQFILSLPELIEEFNSCHSEIVTTNTLSNGPAWVVTAID